MATKLRSEIKANFQTGLIPVESHYTDLIDSSLNISESNTGRINLVGDVSMSGNISASGASSVHTLGGTILDVKGNITSSGAISSSGLITGKDAEIYGNITASGNIKGGNFVVGGSLTATAADYASITASAEFSASGNTITTNITSSGIISSSAGISSPDLTIDDYVIHKGDANTYFGFQGGDLINFNVGGTSKLSITPTNFSVTGPITASTGIKCTSLNTGQGNYELFAMDQSVTTTSAVTFGQITLTKSGISAGNFGDTIATEGQSFKITINNIPTIPGTASGKIFKTVNNAITNDSLAESSVIFISSTSDLSAVAFRIAAGSCLFSISNESTSDFTAGTAVFNFTIF